MFIKYIIPITLLLKAGLLTTAAYADNAFLNRFPIDVVTEGVYVIQGSIADPAAENQGFINNPAFVITETGIVVIYPCYLKLPVHSIHSNNTASSRAATLLFAGNDALHRSALP